jgi:hypothetical protein
MVRLLALFAVTSVAYSVVVPVFNAPDEPFHFEYIRFVAREGVLPDQTREDRRISAEGFQPPLYYALAAAPLRLLAPGSADDIRIHRFADIARFAAKLQRGFPRAIHPPLNPRYVKWGRGTEPNMFLTTAAERLPFSGSIRVIHLLRLLSVGMGTLTVWLVWRTAALALPERESVAPLAASLCAFCPQFAFLSGMLNNDNLVTLLCTAALYFLTRVLLSPGDDRSGKLLLGGSLGLALLAKLNAVPVALVAGAAVLAHAARRPGQRARNVAVDALLVGLPLLALCGWFFVRSLLLYGADDPLGFELRAQQHPDLVLVPERRSWFFGSVFFLRLFMSWWGQFDWLTLLMPGNVYAFFALLGLLGVLGLVGFLARDATRDQRRQLSIYALLLGACFASLVLLNRIFLAEQGRLLFPAIGAAAILHAVGLDWLVAKVAGRWPAARDLALNGLSAGLFALNVWLLATVIHPAYH